MKRGLVVQRIRSISRGRGSECEGIRGEWMVERDLIRSLGWEAAHKRRCG